MTPHSATIGVGQTLVPVIDYTGACLPTDPACGAHLAYEVRDPAVVEPWEAPGVRGRAPGTTWVVYWIVETRATDSIFITVAASGYFRP